MVLSCIWKLTADTMEEECSASTPFSDSSSLQTPVCHLSGISSGWSQRNIERTKFQINLNDLKKKENKFKSTFLIWFTCNTECVCVSRSSKPPMDRSQSFGLFFLWPCVLWACCGPESPKCFRLNHETGQRQFLKIYFKIAMLWSALLSSQPASFLSMSSWSSG
jgi:hypothetical protein